MTTHACVVSRSKETGTVVACSCGLALGPYPDHAKAIAEARAHREVCAPPRVPTVKTDEERERANAANRARRAARKAGI